MILGVGSTPAHPRLILGDDHGLVAEGIRLLLEPHYRILGVFGDGKALVRAALDLRPEVILSDIRMPGLNGLEVCEEIRRAWPEARVLILSMYHSPAYIRRAQELGARGFVSKNLTSTVLLSALEAVLAEGTSFPNFPDADPLGGGDGREVREKALLEPLTRRQKEILMMVARGLSAKEIATRIGISPRTVEFHKQRTMRELGLRSSPELVAYVMREYPAELEGV